MKRILLMTTMLCWISVASAQMTGWQHIQPLTVSENSGDTLIGYQLPLTLNTAELITAGDLSADGSDLRFTSSCTGGISFPYWIDNGINTDSTKIWVRIDTLFANESRTIYMQYGNASATGISAIEGTLDGPNSCTDSVSGGAAGGVTDSQRGIRFAANEDLLVTAFGKNEPTGSTRYITLFDVATQAVLVQAQISGPAGQYSYQDLPSPYWLTQGTQYLIECYQDSADGYYFGPSTAQIGEHLTYLDMRYCNSCDQNTYPTNYLNSIHYGYPDFWYFSRKNVTPAPSYELTGFLTNLADEVSFCLSDSVQLALQVSGGEIPFAFEWTGGQLSNDTLMMPLVSPSDTTLYYVTVTDNCGYVRTDSIDINVNPLPEISIQADFSTFCLGQTGTLSVDGDYAYLWSSGATGDSVISAQTNSATWSVIATDTNMCSAADTFEWNVIQPVYNSQTVNICFGETYAIGTHTYAVNGTYIDTIAAASTCDSIVTTQLTIGEDIDADIQWVNVFTLVADAGADSYQWISCDDGAPLPGATEPFYEVTSNGSYACILTVNNCSEQSPCMEMAFIGLEELSEIESVRMFPNPNNGLFEVESSVSQDIIVTDASGRSVKTVSVTAGQSSPIDLRDAAPGMYLLVSKTKIIRFVVE